MWQWPKKLVRPPISQSACEPTCDWIEPNNNPWGVPVLDVRPITQTVLSTSDNSRCAENALSFGLDDGSSFVGIMPRFERTTHTTLTYPVDVMLYPGRLFVPHAMEQKWAIYFLNSQIIIVRSWLRDVSVVAETCQSNGVLEISSVRGAFQAEGEPEELTIRMLDFLIRSHALGLVYPAPLLDEFASLPKDAAIWSFSLFGNLVHFVTPHLLPMSTPDRPLRTDSLLHLAVYKGDASEVVRQLDLGIPVSLRCRIGLSPLHWCAFRDDKTIDSILLERGLPIDSRAEDGSTPLMHAIEHGNYQKVRFLIEEGSDVNAADNNGFTPLHRAAERGQEMVVDLLLARGSDKDAIAMGEHTAYSLAKSRGEREVLKKLDNA